jgi:hypothetical protein
MRLIGCGLLALTFASSGSAAEHYVEVWNPPEARQPVVRQSEARQLDARQPVARQPDARQPVARQPDTRQPVARQPNTRQLDARQPVARQPMARQPDAHQPGAHSPAGHAPAALAAHAQAAHTPPAHRSAVLKLAARHPHHAAQALKTRMHRAPATTDSPSSMPDLQPPAHPATGRLTVMQPPAGDAPSHRGLDFTDIPRQYTPDGNVLRIGARSVPAEVTR